MDPEYSLQDVVRCHLCEAQNPPLHCDICEKYLCETCKEVHLSDESKDHRLVPFELRRSTTKCKNHSTNICELFCEQCGIPICKLCVSPTEHQTHEVVDILKSFESKKRDIQKELQELEKSIYSKYQEVTSKIPDYKADLNENFQNLTKAINKCGAEWHKEINNIVKKLKSDLDEMKNKSLDVLNKQKEENTRIIFEIEQSIADLNKLMDSKDISLVSAFKSKNVEFRRMLKKITVSLPCFDPQKIHKEHICSLSMFSIDTEDYYMYSVTDSLNVESSPSNKQIIDKPLIISNIKTNYEQNTLRSLSCLSDEEIWACGQDSTMRLYNLHGALLKSIQTKSGYRPRDIVVTGSGDLVYADYKDRTVNMIKNTRIREVIRLLNWRPRGVCCTSSEDLLVVMDSDDETHTKVVRYSGSTEKQSIQYDDNAQPIYSSGGISNIKYICENRNQDVCVSDWTARAVVVANKAGKLRFRYTGTPFTTKDSFEPYGITTDSQGRILTADSYNLCIHILDRDGQFLRCIDNCDLHRTWGLCVDNKDYLYVVEDTGNVKKIQYYM